MEERTNEQRAMIGVDEREPMHYVSPHVRRQVQGFKIWAMSIVTIAILALVGVGIWKIWDKVAIVGYVALGVALVLLVCAGAFPVVALMHYTFQPRFRSVDAFGGYFTNIFGFIRPAPPMNPANTRVNTSQNKKKAVTEITPIVPSIMDLIDTSDIAHGSLEMVHGYDKDQLNKGVLELVTSPWPGTYAVIGKGRSGKSRRVIAQVCQALIAGARVTICDPHGSKPSGLSNQLEALWPWLHIVARTDEEIETAALEFLSEMESRHDEHSGEWNKHDRGTPRFIVFDEWPRLMLNDKISDEAKKVFIDVARNCQREYTDYDGYACIIGQEWTQDSIGDTAIRKGLHALFCHNINPEYASFFFMARNQKKWASRADELKKRECIYKDYEGNIREIITITVPDEAATRVAEYMAQIAAPAPKKEIPAASSQGYSQAPQYAQGYQGTRSGHERQTGPLHLPEQTAHHHRYELPERSSSFYEAPTSELEKRIVNEGMNAGEYPMNGVQTPREQGEAFTKNEQVSGEGFTMRTPQADKPAYTHEQETMILNAAVQLLRESGKLTRSDIMERLNWTRAQWPILKAVCDKHGVAKQ